MCFQELYQKLVASTARSAALANKLAEMHHKFQNGLDEVDHDDDEDEDEVEPKTDDESIANNEEESEILISEVDSIKGQYSSYLSLSRRMLLIGNLVNASRSMRCKWHVLQLF